jgi:L-alanine-DL-glutamate epimerase-like enolase superfamily enzyme
MRITGVRTILYEYPLRHPVGDVQAHGFLRMADLAVFLETDEALLGVAIAGAGAGPAVHALAAELVGRDPRAVRALYERMQRIAFKAGPQGSLANAIAALDCALWDLRAKANGVPLWRELGASSGRVAAYASGLDMALSDDELRTYYRRMSEQYGIRAGKLKVGRDLDRDLERLAVMRDALASGSEGARPSLMIDANEFWSPKQAIRHIAAIEREFDLVWAEEPVRRDDHRGLARVSRAVRTAVATGENLTAPQQFAPLVLNEAADVLQMAVGNVGITGGLRIAETADTFGMPFALVNCPGRYAAHLATVMPNHLMMEVLDVGRDAVFSTGHRLEGGEIVLGETPGIGLVFDEALLARHAADRPSAGTPSTDYRRSPDSGLAESGAPDRTHWAEDP